MQENALGFCNFIFVYQFCIKSFAFSFSYAFFCLFFSFMHLWVFLCQSFMMFYYLKLWERMLQKPLVPTACISGDCNQTWPGSGTSGCAGFRILKRLWQIRGLENKAQLWPILSCVISRFLCPKNSVIKIHAYLYRLSGNFLVSFCILFHELLQFVNVLRNLEWRSKTVWMFNRDQNFRGNSFTRND